MWLRCMGGVFFFGQKENLDAPITRACAPQSQLMVVCWWDICGPPSLSSPLFIPSFLFIFTCLIFDIYATSEWSVFAADSWFSPSFLEASLTGFCSHSLGAERQLVCHTCE